MRGTVRYVRSDEDAIEPAQYDEPGAPVGAAPVSQPPPGPAEIPAARPAVPRPAGVATPVAPRPRPPLRGIDPRVARAVRKARRKGRLAALIAVCVMLTGVGLSLGAYYFD